MDSARRSSRSRSRTPAEFNIGEIVTETKTTARSKRLTPSLTVATSTPTDNSTSNSLTAISESYSETTVVHNSKITSVNDNNVNSKRNNISTKTVLRSGKPRVILTDQMITNGESTKSKEPVLSIDKTTTSSSTILTNKKKAALGKSKSTLSTKTSDYSSDDDDEKYRTLKTYKNAGDWWNAFPKTDYTYSPLSEYRKKDVAPGVHPVPNMSRRSLASVRGLSSPTTSTSTYRETYTSSFANTLRSRATQRSNRSREEWLADMSDTSDVDEVDTVVKAAANVSYFTTLITTIMTVITTVWTTTVETSYAALGRITGNRVAAGYSTPRRHGGAVGRSWWRSAMDWVYLSVARLELLDTRILSWFHSRSAAVNDTDKRRRLKWFLLLLCFLLLPLAGFWYWDRSASDTFDPVLRIVTENWPAVSGFMMIPFARKDEESYVTHSIPEPLTQHSDEYVAPTTSSHLTMTTSDIDKLTTRIINNRQMQLLVSSNQKPIDFEALITRIVNSDQIKTMIASNQKDIDTEKLTADILASNELQLLIASNRKDVDLEALTYYVVSSSQMREYVASNQREPDVDLLVTQIVNSGVLRQFVASSQKEIDVDALIARVLGSSQFSDWATANEKSVDVDAIITQVLASVQLQNQGGETNVDLLAVQVAGSSQFRELTSAAAAADKESLANLELRQAELQEELRKKSEILEEQKLALARLSAELARTKDQIDGAAAKEGVRDTTDEVLGQKVAGLEEQIKILQDQQLSIRTCCDKPAPALPLVAIEQHVTRFLTGALGQSGGDVRPDELKAWIANVFVARDELEARIANLMKANKREVDEATTQSADKIMQTISDQISQQHVLVQHRATPMPDDGAGLSDDRVRAIVNEALVTYDADKTGMVDYALESSGGQILSTRCTEVYYKRSGSIMLFGVPLWRHQSNNPRSVLQPGVHPGECWAFAGSRGRLVIELAGNIRISSFSVEHIPRTLAFAGVIDSAPKDFIVFGLESLNDPEPIVLGTYRYDQNGTSLQHFIVSHSHQRPFKIIELQIESNHGNMEYTCLYRFRVHGTWVSN